MLTKLVAGHVMSKWSPTVGGGGGELPRMRRERP